MLALLFSALCSWHTWIQLRCLHFAEALFMGLEAKRLSIYGLFHRWLNVCNVDALNEWWDRVIAGLIISLWFKNRKNQLLLPRSAGSNGLYESASNFQIGHVFGSDAILLLLVEMHAIQTLSLYNFRTLPDCQRSHWDSRSVLYFFV